MMTKAFVVLAVICSIQAIYGSPISEISDETRQKLQKAIIGVVEAKKHSGAEVNSVRDVIEKRVDAALNPIEKELKDLKHRVKEAEKDAKVKGIDIKECVKQEKEASHHVDKDVVKHCRDTKETLEAGKKVGEIGHLVHVLRNARQACVNKTETEDACVNKLIKDATEKAVQLQKEVTAIIKKANPDTQNACIAEGAKKLQSEVTKISQQWDACLEKHKPTEKSA